MAGKTAASRSVTKHDVTAQGFIAVWIRLTYPVNPYLVNPYPVNPYPVNPYLVNYYQGYLRLPQLQVVERSVKRLVHPPGRQPESRRLVQK